MYRIPVYKVMLVKEGNQSAENKVLSEPKDVHDILSGYLHGLDREHFVVLLLDVRRKPIGINTVSIGGLNQTIVHPREVFKPAILSNAAAMILAHNHPSGDPKPSSEDISITQRIVEAGELLGIQVLDHIVIGEDDYCSLKVMGSM